MQPSRDIGRLLEIMAALRNPETGCPWDLVQTHQSLTPYALEEAYEVVDAIEGGDMGDLCEELGDLLLQVVFHARVAEEAGAFAFGEVVEAVTSKMIRRHPHIFAIEGPASDPSDRSMAGSSSRWEAIKAAERAAKRGPGKAEGLLADVPVALPGLTRAVKLQKKASTVGFDWGDARLVLAKIREEIDEIDQAMGDDVSAEAVAGEIGDLIFAVANLARHARIDPEAAVRSTNAKFERRFAFIEAELAAQGTTPEEASLATMDALWDTAKRQGL